MKLYYTILFLIFFSVSSFAQIVRIDTLTGSKSNYVRKKGVGPKTQTEFLYSAGLGLFSYSQYPKILNEVDDDQHIGAYLNSLMFKFNDNQLSYRLSGSYFQKNIEFKNDCPECETTSGQMKDVILKVGFEKNLTYTVLQPYFGADIGFRRNRFFGKSKNAGTTKYTVPYDVKTEKTGGLIAPFIGLKANIYGNFTLAAEAALDSYYSYETQEKNYQDTYRTRSFTKTYRWEFLSRPLSTLSLQYNFGLSH